MKFKVGDNVKTPYGDGVVVYIDEKAIGLSYLVKVDGKLNGCNWSEYGYDNPDGIKDKWWFMESELTLIETQQDLRDLLKVGYKFFYKYKHMVDMSECVINNKQILNASVGYLWEYGLDKAITKIYRPKYNGLKPMEWELVWEREEHKEQLFTLEIPKFYQESSDSKKMIT